MYMRARSLVSAPNALIAFCSSFRLSVDSYGALSASPTIAIALSSSWILSTVAGRRIGRFQAYTRGRREQDSPHWLWSCSSEAGAGPSAGGISLEEDILERKKEGRIGFVCVSNAGLSYSVPIWNASIFGIPPIQSRQLKSQKVTLPLSLLVLRIFG